MASNLLYSTLTGTGSFGMMLPLHHQCRGKRVVQVGDRAPDFTRKSTRHEEVSLRDFLGKKNVILFFFPLAFTPV